MNKKDMLSTIAEKSGMSVADVENVLNVFMSVATDAITQDDKVTLIGFGTFESRIRPAREARNPHDKNAVVHVPERRTVVFKPGKTLRDKLRENEKED